MSATIPTASRPIHLLELPPVLSAKMAILRATDPGLYTMITRRDPITNQPLTEQDTAA
ncbi:hypothetical protein [Arthrobacter sp. SD76]|uniref:hypothetical protein n=1 Tax=Arthrobacter sp. SD76 TaxID=3415007 RepID=UPI003C76723E